MVQVRLKIGEISWDPPCIVATHNLNMIISTATQWLNTNTKHGEQKQDPELAQWEVLCGGCYGQRRHKLSHKARLGLGGPEHVRLPDKT